MKIDTKIKLPPGFIYLISFREIREFLRAQNDFDYEAKFTGIYYGERRNSWVYKWDKPTFYPLSMYIERAPERWLLKVRLSGIRKERIGEHRQEVSAAILSEAAMWLNKKKTTLEEERGRKPNCCFGFTQLRETKEIVRSINGRIMVEKLNY